MGKINSTITFRGKVGNLVGMKGADGKTYIRVVSDDPKNPNTPAQRKTRARLTLTGQITKLVPPEILIGMGDTTIRRRLRFNSNLMKNANAELQQNGAITVSIPEEKILFSDGPAGLQPVIQIAPDTDFGPGLLQLSINFETQQNLPDGYTQILYLIIAIFSDGTTLNDLQYIISDNDTIVKFYTNTANTVADIYCIPIATKQNESNSTVYPTTIADGGTTWNIVADTITTQDSTDIWYRSIFVGSVKQGDAAFPGTEPDQPAEP